MWQRMTQRANQVLAFAEEEAARLGGTRVEPEHLLLGLAREQDSTAMRVLERLGLHLESLAEEVEARLPHGHEGIGEKIEVTPATKAVLNTAYDEARRLRDSFIGTEHLLLGLIRQHDSLAARVLAGQGAELERTRNEVAATHNRDEESQELSASLREQMRKLVAFRQDETNRSGDGAPTEDPWSYTQALLALSRRVADERSSRSAEANAVLAVDLARAACRGLGDLQGIADLSREQAWALLALGRVFKETLHISKTAHREILAGKTLAMVFERPALRTRVTFETGMFQLGGHALAMAQSDSVAGRPEMSADLARSLELWVDGILARAFLHPSIAELAQFSRVPVINGLSDQEHPCEGLAAFQTIWERRGAIEGQKVVFIGNKRHVAQSLLLLGAKLGAHMVLATPEGWAPEAAVLAAARADAEAVGGSVIVTADAQAACRDADVIYTDAWADVAHGEDPEAAEARLQGLQVNEALAALAKPDYLFMHCLPARRGVEVTPEVIDGPNSVVFHQAENRLHAQKAVLAVLLGGARSR